MLNYQMEVSRKGNPSGGGPQQKLSSKQVSQTRMAVMPETVQEDPADLLASLPKPIKHKENHKVDDIAQDLNPTD
jgi:hypothetical protein